jgi:ATP-dependent exoDNAse (exonuclease V) beta subunit
MPMSEAPKVPDLGQRRAALDPARSFIVQAPAGSGKTELLIQRFLALLARVDRPEEIAAITFTIKAAAEMRKRVFEALAAARRDPRPEAPHEALTWELARAALERNDALGWHLEESADRLRVQTIDALCAALTRQMPVLSRFGGQPESIEDARTLYAQAARNLLATLEEKDDPASADVARLLTHLDNNAAEAERLLAAMLMQRDHWIRTLRGASERAALERSLAAVRTAAVRRARALWPARLVAPRGDDVEGWVAHANALLTGAGEWRKREAIAQALSGEEALREALEALQGLPPAAYSDDQWDALEAILRLAPRAVAELQLVFARAGQADFIEISQGALRALGTDDEPTDLMLALDYRIRHLLVDEFQDTSFTQMELLERLTSGWEAGDGRTLFVVGDPMQSIYRFREAEVGLFLRAWHHGIGTVKLEPLRLSANFRSRAGIVDWVNATFGRVMPAEEDIPSGAVPYAPSQAVHPHEGEAIAVHAFFGDDRAAEGARVAEVAARSAGSVAILVRNRNHLLEVLPRLRDAGVAFRAIEIENLGHRPAVQDLLALTRALDHLGDRTAWLAVLRAPWCGLTLADLAALCGGQEKGATVWAALHDTARLERLTPDGWKRLERTRAVLARALASRRRGTLRGAVEDAWLALGGPACVEGDTDLEDADIYLDRLEAAESGGTLADIRAFEASLADLFALPDVGASDRVQVMTIHKAKGLEFDTVILPGLDSGTGRDDRRLFMWMETADKALLLAPINPSGGDDDPTYRFIRDLDKRKADHESARLLYVAATRARRELHLLGCAKCDDHGAVQAPSKGSLLAKLWPVLAASFGTPGEPPARAPSSAVPREAQRRLRRLDPERLRYDVPPAVAWAAPRDDATRDLIEFSWVGDTARRVGSVVHRWLQRIAEEPDAGWNRARVEKSRGAIRRELAARGVVEGEIERACERVVGAVAGALEDERGRWLLGPQRKARNEYRLSAIIAGVRHVLVIDRVFEDAQGQRWIVDYKTSSHEGADVERFLADEEARYREQLERYATALAAPDAKRCLYFPLLRAAREWPRAELPARGTTLPLFP